MQPIQPDAARLNLPRILIYAVALTCGVLAGLAAQIWLAGAGYDATTVLQSPISTKSLQLRTAAPWWAIAGAAFIVSGFTAAILNRPAHRRQFRVVRWIVAAAIVFGLAHIGHSAGGHAAADPVIQVVTTLAVLAVAALMALLGAYLTVRR